MIWGLQLFYSIGSSQGLQVVSWSPQATVLILVTAGSVACIVTCLAVPRMQRLRYWRGPTKMPLKRMNLLGLVRAAALARLLISSCCMSSDPAFWDAFRKGDETAPTASLARLLPCSIHPVTPHSLNFTPTPPPLPPSFPLPHPHS